MIYVGHIPYGFFETQMKAYFSQFGEVLNIRLSRNKKVRYVRPHTQHKHRDTDTQVVLRRGAIASK